jgi:hypothetical protein
MKSRTPDQPNHPLTTVMEFAGCVWFDGSGEISDSEPEWPSVEIGNGDESFCEVWLGQAERICAGASQRSRRVMLRFVMNELIKRAVEDFLENFETWRTDAEPATTHALVRRLEHWLTRISWNEL